MTNHFETYTDRRGTNSIKWTYYPEDVLPLWVADMDFPAPEAVRSALSRAVAHGILGYEFPSAALSEVIAARMERYYGWQVSPAAIVAIPGVIAGFVAAAHAACTTGEGVLIQPPVYPPFLSLHEKTGLVSQIAPLHLTSRGQIIEYDIDTDIFIRGLNSDHAHTAMFLLCNPHNPTGQMYSRPVLEAMALTCMRNKTVICSDEIHAEILLNEKRHIPIASLAPEIADQTITLIAPSKTFNIPGLFSAFAIITQPALREKFKKAVDRLAMHVNSLGLIAAEAAYSGACDEWLKELLVFLKSNRDFLVDFVRREWPGLKVTNPDATYLGWMDCCGLNLTHSPHHFFLTEAKVALNDGKEFGPGGESFVRLNFGCPRQTLIEALERMKSAMLRADKTCHPIHFVDN